LREKKIKEGLKGRGEDRSVKDGSVKEGVIGGVRVGSVLVRVGGEGKKGGESVGLRKVGAKNVSTDKQPTSTKLIRNYRSCDEDVDWAKHGLIGTVIDGASIPLIQSRGCRF
jgi:hypothetical protein